MKKVKTFKDIENDPRINCLTRNYDGKGTHMVEATDGWLFWGETMSGMGSVKSLCDDINYYLIQIKT